MPQHNKYQNQQYRQRLAKQNSLSWLKSVKPTLGWVPLTLALTLLSGCMSAAMTGADLVYHRNRFTDYAQNNFISIEGQRQLNEAPQLANTTISLTGFQNIALLVGHAQTEKQKDYAEQMTWRIPGVKRVVNRITIGPTQEENNTLSDSWITTKVGSNIVFHADFDPDNIKIVTDNGIVYLMGQLTQPEAEQAITFARDTTGVKKVVTLITYLVPSSIPIPTFAKHQATQQTQPT